MRIVPDTVKRAHVQVVVGLLALSMCGATVAWPLAVKE